MTRVEFRDSLKQSIVVATIDYWHTKNQQRLSNATPAELGNLAQIYADEFINYLEETGVFDQIAPDDDNEPNIAGDPDFVAKILASTQ